MSSVLLHAFSFFTKKWTIFWQSKNRLMLMSVRSRLVSTRRRKLMTTVFTSTPTWNNGSRNWKKLKSASLLPSSMHSSLDSSSSRRSQGWGWIHYEYGCGSSARCETWRTALNSHHNPWNSHYDVCLLYFVNFFYKVHHVIDTQSREKLKWQKKTS